MSKCILYIINSLSIGGAEMMLYKLLSHINRGQFNPVVISLLNRGTLGDRIEALGIPVYAISMTSARLPITSWWLLKTINQLKPDLIEGWMYHSSLAAQLTRIMSFRSVPVLWNIRHSLYSLDYEKRGTATVIKLLASLSSFANKIIYNSKTSAEQHQNLGYQSSKTVIVPNGFDTKVFQPSLVYRARLRAELGLSNETFLIGLIGRYHPMKDHANFLQAAAIFLREYPDVQFLLVGRGVDWKNQSLGKLIHELGLVERIHLLGERQDMPRIMAALDIATSASAYGEGFPNVIGEAMSCGVPCVVTDVGDSAQIVGNVGMVVPPREAKALSKAWKELIAMGQEGRAVLGKAARRRVMDYFSLSSVVAQYEELYRRVLS